METRSRRRLRTAGAVLAAAAVVATAGIAGPAWAATDDTPATPAPTVKAGQTLDLQKLSADLKSAPAGRYRVFVQLSGAGAADAAAAASSTSAGKSAAKSRRGQIQKSADSAFAAARGKDKNADKLYTTTNTVPGFAAELDSAAIDALAARSDVVKITPLVPKHLDNSSTAQLTKAVNNWQANNTGKGVRVGVIDTGIDYTHADFGGPGTVEAYQAAFANSAGAWTPTAKVVGGYDFVGDNYNADPDASDYQPVPHPDPNPLDCNEHGTHVAGTVAGYGVNADGTTFTGSYRSLTGTALDGMRVGPGMAPGASLYALKVFGCTGSTDAVISALDWAVDPNGDGDFSDHLDIVNLSLGSDYGVADDPENAVVNELAKHGVLPVMSAGNAGDLTSIGGSPGNAIRSLAVASTVDALQLRDGLVVNTPADVAGTASGQFSVAYPWGSAAPVTGDVVPLSAANADGCTPFSAADAATVAGKIAWLEWDDNDATRACGSAARALNASNAGAIGSIFTSGLDVFAAGITGSDVIPVIQLPKAETDRLRPALDAGTLNVTFDGSLRGTIASKTDSIVDTLSSFSSRGVHGSVGVVKPDIAAPGDTITSAGMGTGNDQLTISGTSMASPNVAGTAALVKYAHPKWTPEQLKAGLMNTAGHDVYAGDGQTGPIYGPNRVGAGRVDSAAAVANDLLIYSKDEKGAVSASFGVVNVPITSRNFTDVRTLTVQNTGKKTKTVSLSYQAITAQPGVTYTVSPSKVTVGAGRSATVRVYLKVNASQLRKTIDQTMDPGSALGVPRQYVSDSSGRVLAKETGKTALRVPVYAAVRPMSNTSTTAIVKTWKGDTTSWLRLNGKGFAQGSGTEAFTSLASVLEYGASSGKLKACKGAQIDGCLNMGSDSSGDLRYVGAGSTPASGTDYSDGWLYFGINTWGEWASWGTTMIPFVDYDVNGDGVPDYETYMQPYPATDVPLAITVDLNTGATVDLEPVNFNFGDVDTNVFDNDTMVLPVWPAAIGVTPTTTSFPITYQVGTFSAYTGGTTDLSPAITYDVTDPTVSVTDPLYLDQSGTVIPYQLGSEANKDTKALVLHLQGDTGDRAEVVKVNATKHKPTPHGKKHGSSKLKHHDWHWMFGHRGH